MLVRGDHRVAATWEVGLQLNVVVMGFYLLDEHDLVYDVYNVEITNVFAEFTGFYLSKIEKILYNVSENTGRRLLDHVTIVQMSHYFVKLD